MSVSKSVATGLLFASPALGAGWADAATKPRIYQTATRGNNCDVHKAQQDRGTLVLSCSGGRGATEEGTLLTNDRE